VKRLFIVGAGGFGREMLAMAEGSVGYGDDFTIAGFLDDRPDALDGFPGYPPVAGSVAGFEIGCDDVFITAIGDVGARRRCVAALEERGAQFVSLVHSTAVLGRNVTVGEGSFIGPYAFVSCDTSIGRHSCVFHGTSIGHDVVMGSFAHVYAQCSIGGGVNIGDGSCVYPGAVVTPRRKIGKDAVVGAHSTVFLDVPQGARVMGSPAAPLA